MPKIATPPTPSEGELAHHKNELVLIQARQIGLLGATKDARLTGRISSTLLEAAKKRAHVTSNTELLEIALSRLVLEDDFGPKLLAQKGTIPEDVDLEF